MACCEPLVVSLCYGRSEAEVFCGIHIPMGHHILPQPFVLIINQRHPHWWHSFSGYNFSQCTRHRWWLNAQSPAPVWATLFTSVYTFNQVALLENGQLYITKNFTRNLGGDRNKRDREMGKWIYFTFRCFSFSWCPLSLNCIQTQFLRLRREKYRDIFTPEVLFYNYISW